MGIDDGSAGEMTLDDAISLARVAHGDTLDRAGRPYIEHPLRVMEQLGLGEPRWGSRAEGEAACMAAVLHDVVEDTAFTADDLTAQGCPRLVVDAVIALSKAQGESYEDFLRRLAGNPVARRVKYADIDDNSDEARLALLPPPEAERLRTKYAGARRLLNDLSAYAGVLETEAAHPEGHYAYFRNDRADIGLMRQWRWDDGGHVGGSWSWPEYLHPASTGGRWKVGNAYMLDAITGMGEDPYSCGEGSDPLTDVEAARLAKKIGFDLDAPRQVP